jgi:putative tryptophan/tyrosine transport system substrate-binding protein
MNRYDTLISGEAMRRREFITILGGAVAWPLKVRAQQANKVPIIGFLGASTANVYENRLNYFRRGLNEMGFVDGQNVAIEYRWADGQYEQLPTLAAQLIQRQVAVIVAGGGTPSAVAAKAATKTLPIVFAVAVDPVTAGLVPSLNKPDGNITGVTNMNVEIGPKRLEFLRELLPSITSVAVLVNPTNPVVSKPFVRGVQEAGLALKIQLHIVNASTKPEIDKAFTRVAQLRAGALIVSTDVFFNSQSELLGALSAQHSVPAVYQYRPFVAAGGLLSYGGDETEYYQLAGAYAGRILKGEKPSDLPVQRSTKVELIINLKTAKALGINVPNTILGRANEVIE